MNSLIHVIEGLTLLLLCALIFQVYRCYKNYYRALAEQTTSVKRTNRISIQVNIPSHLPNKLPDVSQAAPNTSQIPVPEVAYDDYVDQPILVENPKRWSPKVDESHSESEISAENELKSETDHFVNVPSSAVKNSVSDIVNDSVNDGVNDNINENQNSLRSVNDQRLNDYIGEFFGEPSAQDATDSLVANIDAFREKSSSVELTPDSSHTVPANFKAADLKKSNATSSQTVNQESIDSSYIDEPVSQETLSTGPSIEELADSLNKLESSHLDGDLASPQSAMEFESESLNIPTLNQQIAHHRVNEGIHSDPTEAKVTSGSEVKQLPLVNLSESSVSELDEMITVESNSINSAFVDAAISASHSSENNTSLKQNDSDGLEALVQVQAENDDDAIIVVDGIENSGTKASDQVMSDKVVHAMLDEAKLICAN